MLRLSPPFSTARWLRTIAANLAPFYNRNREPRGYPYSFEELAQVNEREERYEEAVQLLAAAATLRARIGAPVEQINQKENEDALTRARARLGDVAYELAWSKGATLTTEQAIALAWVERSEAASPPKLTINVTVTAMQSPHRCDCCR
jgi:hypothetical protein